MSPFSPARFRRLLLNDMLALARPVGMGTLAAFLVTVLFYLFQVATKHPGTVPPLRLTLFGLQLFGAGLPLTGMVFRDLHHPLERYRYLLLPCTNMERLAARYLLTGPLLVLYVIAAFMLMDLVGLAVVSAWDNNNELPRDSIAMLALRPFNPFAASTPGFIAAYLFAHAVMMAGAICFRSHALIRTAVAISALLVSMGGLTYLGLRILNPDSFSGWKTVGPSPLLFWPAFDASWLNVIAIVAFALWFLYIAYCCLREHEVQGGV